MKKSSLIFFILFCVFLNAQKSLTNISLNETDNKKILSKYLKYENLCNKLKFVEENIYEFVTLDSKHKNLDVILENISEKSNYEIQIIVAYGSNFTSVAQRKEKLFEDISKIKESFKCLNY